MHLRALQRAFASSVLGADPTALEALDPPPAGSRVERFDIYREGYRLRLIESLATDYPATKALLGEERFSEVARAFVEGHPSPYFNLRWYGGEFAGFISEQRLGDDALVGGMATFEWAIAGAFDAPDVNAITAEQMASIPPDAWPALGFEFHPTVRRIEIPVAVPEIWKAATANQPLPAPFQISAVSSWLVWRKDLAVLYRRVELEEGEALDAAECGADFGEVCIGLAAHVAEAETAVRAAVLLRRWIEEGLIAALRGAPQ
jgi:hypothetical protein